MNRARTGIDRASTIVTRPLPGIWLILCCVAALALLSCGDDGPTPVPWSPLPLDGRCQSGLVLQPGESCVHTFTYVEDVRIDDSGVTAIVGEVVNRFRVDSEGLAHYGENLSGTTLTSAMDIGDRTVTFSASRQSDGTFYIEEATPLEQLDLSAAIAEGLPCETGAELLPGESCALSATSTFSVQPDGQGCFNSTICGRSRLTVQDFVAERADDRVWRIVSLP